MFEQTLGRYRNATVKLAPLVLACSMLSATSQVWAQYPTGQQRFTVIEQDIDDLKAVFATVRSKDRIEARVRTPGTVVSLKVDEGALVEPAQLLALIADPKIALRIESLDAQIVGLEARVATAKLDYERAEQLLQRRVTPKARVDQLKTIFDVAANELKSVQAERLLAEQQIAEGQVLAPAAGRLLHVPVTVGSVVLPGESIATIAANEFLLRLELPERHARFIKKGDLVKLGGRGLEADQNTVRQGQVVQVYPELRAGRVLADATISGLGDYFVGERALAWISAGKRRTVVIPTGYVYERFGLDYVQLVQQADAKTGDMSGQNLSGIVIQLGQQALLPDGAPGIEVLAGLHPGDVIAKPSDVKP